MSRDILSFTPLHFSVKPHVRISSCYFTAKEGAIRLTGTVMHGIWISRRKSVWSMWVTAVLSGCGQSWQNSCLRLTMGSSSDETFCFVVFGASGDLAKKKIYPTLWTIFKQRLIPRNTKFIGYARSKITIEDVQDRCKPWFKVGQVSMSNLGRE